MHHYVFASDEAQGERAKQSIKAKCIDYLERAEELKVHLEKKKKVLTAIHVMLLINGRPSSPSQIYSRGVVNNITRSVILTLMRGFHIVCTFGYLNKYIIDSLLKSRNLKAALSIHNKQLI